MYMQNMVKYKNPLAQATLTNHTHTIPVRCHLQFGCDEQYQGNSSVSG